MDGIKRRRKRMWSAQLVWKHDCVVGNRCEKFNVEAYGIPIGFYKENGKMYYSHIQVLKGDRVQDFLEDLRADPRVHEFEEQGNFVFFSYVVGEPEDIVTAHTFQKVFFFKPVRVDKKGYEWWEVSSWSKKHLESFIDESKKGADEFRIVKIEQTDLGEIYFARLKSSMTELQRRAFELATEDGYYDYHRKTELSKLSKKMGISLSTYREHLRRAEKKVFPEFARHQS